MKIETVWENDHSVVRLKGILDERSVEYFRNETEKLFALTDELLVLNASGLERITQAGIEEIRRLSEGSKQFALDELNQDCYVALFLSGLQNVAGRHMGLPEIDLSQCQELGHGANGDVYRVDDELIIKTFRKQPTFDEISWERTLTRNALRAGVPCPISFGYAMAEGKIALLFEMVKSTSFVKMVRKDRANIQLHIDEYVDLVKKLHGKKGDVLNDFPRYALLKELIRKSEKLDDLVGEEYAGVAKKMLESIDEPEVLIHGDIQPSNIRFGASGTGFIDMETISTGPAIIDIGALRRTLFFKWEFSGETENTFLGITSDESVEIWESFISRYYANESGETVSQKLLIAEIISDILSLSLLRKRAVDWTIMENGIGRLRELLTQWKNFERSPESDRR